MTQDPDPPEDGASPFEPPAISAAAHGSPTRETAWATPWRLPTSRLDGVWGLRTLDIRLSAPFVAGLQTDVP